MPYILKNMYNISKSQDININKNIIKYEHNSNSSAIKINMAIFEFIHCIAIFMIKMLLIKGI